MSKSFNKPNLKAPFWIGNYAVENCIKDLREKKGLSQEALAELVGLSRNAIGSIERGAAIPTVRLAFCLSLVFEVPVNKIFDIKLKERKEK